MRGLNSQHLATSSDPPAVDPEVITLFTCRYCPFAQRNVLVLLAKNLEFNLINVNLATKPEWFTLHPEKKVPVLQHRNLTLFESSVISRYLEERYTEPKLGPDTPAQRAIDGGVMSINDSFVVPSMWKLFFPQSDEVKAELVTRLCHGLDLLEAELKARRSKFFFSNTSAGLLDYHIWPWLERLPALHNVLRKIDIPWQKFPRMEAWFAAMEGDASVIATRIPDDIHATFLDLYGKGKPRYDFLDD